MKKIYVFRILAALIIAVLVLAAAVPAFAGAPEHFEMDAAFSGPVLNPCGFDIQVRTTGTLNVTRWVDENGVQERFYVTVPNVKSTFSANGKSINLQLSGPNHVFTDFSGARYTYITLGTWGFTTIPGTGHVMGWTGQIKYVFDMTTFELVDYKAVGNPNITDWDAICAYLAP